MIKKLTIFFIILLLLSSLIFINENDNKEFSIKNISISNGNKVTVYLNGYEYNKINCEIISPLNNDFVILLPPKNPDVLISVLNLKNGIYYLAIKSNGNIKKNTFNLSENLLREIKNPKEAIFINEQICYALYPLVFGDLKENNKVILKYPNVNSTLKTLENENFKFEFLLNASYYEDVEDGNKNYDHRIISSIHYNFSFIKLYINQDKFGWIDVPTSYIKDKFNFLLKPELTLKLDADTIYEIFPSTISATYKKNPFEILYLKNDKLNKFNINENRTDLPDTSYIKYKNLISENTFNHINLNKPVFKDLKPVLDGKIFLFEKQLN